MDNLAEIKNKLGQSNYQKLIAINNPKLHQFIVKYVKLCNPDKVFVTTDSPEDVKYIRERAIRNGEESRLSGTMEGHTIHFDSYYDQGRDKAHTCILVPPSLSLGSSGPLTRADVVLEPIIETKPRTEGLNEIQGILKDIMKGKELYICFFCLGPTNSEFSIPAVQLTDSGYVAHSETLLYRLGYEEFKKQGPDTNPRETAFFSFVHSAGELDERKVCKNIAQRRIYIDCEENIVYSVNTQYGGNTLGLKKLAMRLAIRQASKKGWLTEHMLIMGVYGPNKRKTYFTGAFPSLCGKTSTAMLDNGSIIGDDIAYLRKINGKVKAVNVEKGMFGIIQGVNSKDDPIQWKAIHTPGEVIFSNVLVTENKKVHWIGRDGKIPAKGSNHSGEWWAGKKDAEGKEIKCSHPNARFTIKLNSFENLDPEIDAPEGVEIGGIVYGGRDSDTWPPVCEAFDWVHGIITKGASLESETTAATLGKEGVREFNPMSNLDFLSIPIGKYIQNNLNFGKDLQNPPLIFGVNYFLKDREGNFLNEKTDKKVWYKWMELRIHKEVDAIIIPIGKIPKYEDLKRLFKEVLGRDYSIDAYNKQFMIRIPENIAKIERITNIYNTVGAGFKPVLDTPKIIFKILEEEKQRLLSAKSKFGDYIIPTC